MYRRNIDVPRRPSSHKKPSYEVSVPRTDRILKFDNLQESLFQIMSFFEQDFHVVWFKTSKFWYELNWTFIDHLPDKVAMPEYYVVSLPTHDKQQITESMQMADLTAVGLALVSAVTPPNYPVYYTVVGPDGTYRYTLTGGIIRMYPDKDGLV